MDIEYFNKFELNNTDKTDPKHDFTDWLTLKPFHQRGLHLTCSLPSSQWSDFNEVTPHKYFHIMATLTSSHH